MRTAEDILATMMAPPSARYVLLCEDCGTVLTRERDSAVVKRARDDEQPCSCGGAYHLAKDAKEGEA